MCPVGVRAPVFRIDDDDDGCRSILFEEDKSDLTFIPFGKFDFCCTVGPNQTKVTSRN